MHKSMYWHILHIYALPTLLMPPTGGAVHCHCKPPECQCHGLVKVIEPVTQQLQVMIWNPVTLRLDKSELPLKNSLIANYAQNIWDWFGILRVTLLRGLDIFTRPACPRVSFVSRLGDIPLNPF